MITCLASSATLFISRNEVEYAQTQQCDDCSEPAKIKYTASRKTRQRIGKRAPHNGCPQPFKSALGPTYRLGTKRRAMRVSGDASSLQSIISHYAFNTSQRIRRSWYRDPYCRRRVDTDPSWPQSQTCTKSPSHLVGRMGGKFSWGRYTLNFDNPRTRLSAAA